MGSVHTSEILAVITATEWVTTPGDVVLYMAIYGGMYEDAVNPSGPDIHYDGRIKADIILDKKIGVSFWNENSAIDFGYLDIAVNDQDSALIDYSINVHTANVDIYRIHRDDGSLELIGSARSSDIGFTDENTIRFRLDSTLQGAFDAPINTLFYDDTYPHLEGKPYPIAWGSILDVEQLLPTVFVDDVYLLYHVTDVEIESFASDVYDRGVALTESAEFVPSADLHGFTLNQNPDGIITCGQITLVDPEDTANNLGGLFSMVRMVATRAGIWGNVHEADLTTLELEIGMGGAYPQYFTQRVVSLGTYLDDIFAGTAGWYYVDEFSEIHFGRLTDPDAATPTLAFTDANVIGHIKVEDDKAPGLSTRLSYGENPGVYGQDELAGYVSSADRLAMTNEAYTVETAGPVLSFFDKAASREPIKLALSYGTSIAVPGPWSADTTDVTADSTVAKADGYNVGSTVNKTSTEVAQIEVDRWFTDLYQKHRHFYSYDIMINDPLFDSISMPLAHLGEVCTLQSDRFDLLATAKNLLIRRTRYNYFSGLLTIEGWG